jgi:hypothetical protein
VVESGRLLSDCTVIKPYPGFESRPLRQVLAFIIVIDTQVRLGSSMSSLICFLAS